MSENSEKSENKVCNSAADGYRQFFSSLGIYTMRDVARYYGVDRPASKKKEQLIEETIAVLTGKLVPVLRSGRGAPVKSDAVSPKLLRDIEKIRQQYLNGLTLAEREEGIEEDCSLSSSSAVGDCVGVEYTGVLCVLEDGTGVLKDLSCLSVPSNRDVFVSSSNIADYALKNGDFVVCYAQIGRKSPTPVLTSLLSVCGKETGNYEERKDFSALKAVQADRKIKLGAHPTLMVVDEFAPIALGHRVLITCSPICQRMYFLNAFTKGIYENNPSVHLFSVLLDVREEEKIPFKRMIYGESVVVFGADEDTESVYNSFSLIFERAKRSVETGGDVVLLVDNFSALSDLYACSDFSVKPETDSISFIKHFFAEAKQCKDGGSLTIVGVLPQNFNCRTDELLFSNTERIANVKITLTDKEFGCVPMVDVRSSYSIGNENLYANKNSTDEKRKQINAVEDLPTVYKI